MKRVLLLVAFVASLAAAVPARAADEQWLRYTSSPDYREIGYGSSYLPAVVLDAAPEGVSLPAFAGKFQTCAKWETPMVDAGFIYMALDGADDKTVSTLYIDTDCDGSLADEKPVKADNVGYGTQFGPIKVDFPGYDGPIAHHMSVLFNVYGETKSVSVSTRGRYEGPVFIGGKEYYIALIDYDSNGAYNDSSPDLTKTDFLVFKGDRSYPPAAPGKFLQVEGKLYQLEVSRDGAYVKVSSADSVPMGSLVVSSDTKSISIGGENGVLTYADLKGGALSVPAGSYGIAYRVIERKDNAGAKWQAFGFNRGEKFQPFVVPAGRSTTLDAGEPYKSTVTFTTGSDGAWNLSANLNATTGERIAFTKNDATPAPVKARIKNADGSYDQTLDFKYG